MDGTVGEIRLFAAGFAPREWAYCMGQLIAVRSNTALFSILGTTYGGNGSTTFGLPNFAGRAAIGAGNGAGLSSYQPGEIIGTNNVTLTSLNLPIHTHAATALISIPVYPDFGDLNTPNGNTLASKTNMYSTEPGTDGMKPSTLNVTLAPTGSNQPLSIMQPSTGMNFIICLTGIFPSRN